MKVAPEAVACEGSRAKWKTRKFWQWAEFVSIFRLASQAQMWPVKESKVLLTPQQMNNEI